MGTVGPVSIYICIADDFQYYKRGIYAVDNCCATTDRHAPIVVGYGTDESNEEYWIVKNSWGELRHICYFKRK